MVKYIGNAFEKLCKEAESNPGGGQSMYLAENGMMAVQGLTMDADTFRQRGARAARRLSGVPGRVHPAGAVLARLGEQDARHAAIERTLRLRVETDRAFPGAGLP